MTKIEFTGSDAFRPVAATPSERRRGRRVVLSLASLVMVLGAVVLAGWLLRWPPVLRILPGAVTMKANAAVGFVLAGLGLAAVGSRRPSARIAATAAATALLLLGGLQLSQELTGIDLGIDELLVEDSSRLIKTDHPGRMGPTTAFGLVVYALGLLAVLRRRLGFGRLALIAATLLLILSVHALVGYIYDVSSFYRIGQRTAMALHTAVGFVVLAAALSCAASENGLASVLVSDRLGGYYARRLIPAVLLVPLLLALLATMSERKGVLSADSASAIPLTLSILLLTAMAVWATSSLERAEGLRLRALGRYRIQDRALESATCGFVIADAGLSDHPILYVNLAFARQTGYSPQEVVGQSFFPVLAPDPEARAELRLASASASGKATSVVLRSRRKDGSEYWSRVSLDTAHGTDVAPYDALASYLVAVHEDISKEVDDAAERERLLAEALAERAEVEKAAQARDVMLSMVSHELRSPLNALQLWSDFLQEGPENDQVKISEAAGHIRGSVQELNRRVSDLVDFTRMSGGALSLTFSRLELVGLLRELVSSLAPICAERGVRLEFRPDPAGPVYLEGDRDRICQVVRNLIDNSVTFSAEGGRVEVGLTVLADEVELRVWDEGRGITPEFLERAFEPFLQGDSTARRTAGGMGLGLYIVKQIVELHAGKVRLESEGIGRGTVVHIRLPLWIEAAADHPACPEPAPLETPAKGDVLLVDDDPLTLRALSLALRSRGFPVRVASQADEAERAIEESRPLVLVCDLMLPGRGGLALMSDLRRSETDSGDRRIASIAVSGHIDTYGRGLVEEAGFDHFLPKPISLEDLLGLLQQLLPEQANSLQN